MDNAAYVLPRSMIVTALSNYTLAFVVVVTLVFSLNDLQKLSESPLGQPYLAIFSHATQSTGTTSAVAIITLILVVSCAINGITITSRLIWSFARDEGLPCSTWLSRVHQTTNMLVCTWLFLMHLADTYRHLVQSTQWHYQQPSP